MASVSAWWSAAACVVAGGVGGFALGAGVGLALGLFAGEFVGLIYMSIGGLIGSALGACVGGWAASRGDLAGRSPATALALLYLLTGTLALAVQRGSEDAWSGVFGSFEGFIAAPSLIAALAVLLAALIRTAVALRR